MDAIRSSETSVLTGATQRNIPDDGILHSHLRETWNRTLLANVFAAESLGAMLLSNVGRNFYIHIYSLKCAILVTLPHDLTAWSSMFSQDCRAQIKCSK
jgi:hypothetical protein